jgi:hypothetical protein
MFIHRPMHMCDIWLVTTIEPVMWQLRRQLQESNFGTVRTSPALEYADLRRNNVRIMSETRSCMAMRGEYAEVHFNAVPIGCALAWRL